MKTTRNKTMQRFKNIILGVAFIAFIASPVTVVTSPVTTVSAATNCAPRFLGIPPWYRGLTTNETASNQEDCSKMKSPSEAGGIGNYITTIVLNIIEAGLFIVGYISVAFILYGGFLFMTGGGNPGQIEKGRKSIMNASIGLLLSIGAIAITNFIFGVLG